MKRDWILIKQMLEAFENESFTAFLNKPYISPEELSKCDSDEQIQELYRQKRLDVWKHLELLMDCHVIENTQFDRENNNNGMRLTMYGHDLLDSIRDKAIWNKIISMTKDAGVALSWEVIKAAIPKAINSIL